MSKEVSLNNFGLVIAYVLPGFTALWGVAAFVPLLPESFDFLSDATPNLGSFLYSSLAAVAVGLTISTIRWMIVDTIHHATGLRPPAWDFALLAERADAFNIIVEHYYHYYQFYANTVVSLLVVLGVRRWSVGALFESWTLLDAGLLTLVVILFAGSRNSLQRYYTRGGQLLSKRSHRRVRNGTAAATAG